MKRQLAHIAICTLRTLAVMGCLLLGIGKSSGQAIEAGVGVGEVIKIDKYLRTMLHETSSRSFWASYVYQTRASEGCSYASDFGYPAFSFGLAVTDFNQVTLYNPRHDRYGIVDYESRMGTSYILYGSFRRKFFRSPSGWSADYTLGNGLGYSTHIYDRESNVDNEMIGSRLSVYFNLSFHLNYRYRQTEFFIGPEFRHLSNGALARPNKGVNKAGVGAGLRYYMTPVNEDDYIRSKQPFDGRGLYLNMSYRPGFKTAIGEWLKDLNSGDIPAEELPYGSYPMYVSHGISLDVMYRYARRFASGLGFDALYEPYIRDVETQNTLHPTPRDMSKWTLGIAGKHEVFFRDISLQMAIGYYINRPFAEYAITDEEYGVYERVGLRYHLPILGNCISVGYNIYAHLTKAYATELVIDFKLPLK